MEYCSKACKVGYLLTIHAPATDIATVYESLQWPAVIQK